MNMLTMIVMIGPWQEEINKEIQEKQEEGWYLRGNPQPVGSLVMLTFEKPEEKLDDMDDYD